MDSCKINKALRLLQTVRMIRSISYGIQTEPDLSIKDNFPDVLKCGDDIVFLDSTGGNIANVYRNKSNKGVNKPNL